jgi:hypothetical protein
MKKNLLPPSQGGLPAKEFEKEHGVSKGKAAQTFKRTIKGMNRGGMTMRKGNMAYSKGGSTAKPRTGSMDYRKGGMISSTKSKK